LRRFRYQALIREHQEELAAIITKEQGKTLADARGDVFRWVLAPPAVLERC
jgi:acyl-CoA reductase-like NAD-dependent aldehyde dehydrogenase